MLTGATDASQCISECIGTLLDMSGIEPSGFTSKKPLTSRGETSSKIFVNKMNSVLSKINLSHTSLNNGTGLPDLSSFSTVQDLIALTNVCLKNDFVKQIVSTR